MMEPEGEVESGTSGEVKPPASPSPSRSVPLPSTNSMRDTMNGLMDRERGCRSRKTHVVSSALKACAEDELVKKEYKEMCCEIPGLTKSTFLMVFSPDGTKMASTHGNHNVYVTDMRTGKNIKTLVGHPRTPWCVAFHPSSNQILASGCLGGQVRIWDLSGGSEVWTVDSQTVISSLAFHPVDRLLVIATCNELYFWDWSQPKPFVQTCTSNSKEKVRYVTFDRLGHKLITGIANAPHGTARWERVRAPVPVTRHSERITAYRRRITPRLVPACTNSSVTGSSSTNEGEENRAGSSSSGTTTSIPDRERRIAVCYRNLVEQYEMLVHRYLEFYRPTSTTDRGTDPMEADHLRSIASSNRGGAGGSSSSSAGPGPNSMPGPSGLSRSSRPTKRPSATKSDSSTVYQSDSSSSSSSDESPTPKRRISLVPIKKEPEVASGDTSRHDRVDKRKKLFPARSSAFRLNRSVGSGGPSAGASTSAGRPVRVSLPDAVGSADELINFAEREEEDVNNNSERGQEASVLQSFSQRLENIMNQSDAILANLRQSMEMLMEPGEEGAGNNQTNFMNHRQGNGRRIFILRSRTPGSGRHGRGRHAGRRAWRLERDDSEDASGSGERSSTPAPFPSDGGDAVADHTYTDRQRGAGPSSVALPPGGGGSGPSPDYIVPLVSSLHSTISRISAQTSLLRRQVESIESMDRARFEVFQLQELRRMWEEIRRHLGHVTAAASERRVSNVRQMMAWTRISDPSSEQSSAEPATSSGTEEQHPRSRRAHPHPHPPQPPRKRTFPRLHWRRRSVRPSPSPGTVELNESAVSMMARGLEQLLGAQSRSLGRCDPPNVPAPNERRAFSERVIQSRLRAARARLDRARGPVPTSTVGGIPPAAPDDLLVGDSRGERYEARLRLSVYLHTLSRFVETHRRAVPQPLAEQIASALDLALLVTDTLLLQVMLSIPGSMPSALDPERETLSLRIVMGCSALLHSRRTPALERALLGLREATQRYLPNARRGPALPPRRTSSMRRSPHPPPPPPPPLPPPPPPRSSSLSELLARLRSVRGRLERVAGDRDRERSPDGALYRTQHVSLYPHGSSPETPDSPSPSARHQPAVTNAPAWLHHGPDMRPMSAASLFRPRFLVPIYGVNPNPFDADLDDQQRDSHYSLYDGIVTATVSPNHRIQMWDFSEWSIPDIRKHEKNVVVSECKIHNDGSVDISNDGTLLVTLLPSGGYLSVTNRLGIYSMEWQTLGQCLYTTSFEQNAISVSLSPISRHLIVGLASRRVTLLPSDRWTMARIFLLDDRTNDRSRLVVLRDIVQGRDRDINFMSVNCIKWIPVSGQGIVYATNTGQLNVLT